MNLLLVLIEGARFYWSICLKRRLWPSRAYLHWRLGTLYGTFDRATGEPRPLRDLLLDLWRDRRNAVKFLLWRRSLLKR